MKTHLFIIAVFVVTFSASAQQKIIKADKVPQNVQDAFKAKFHDATINKWTTENNIYTVKCKQGKKKHEVCFNTDGKWMKTSTMIKWKEVPEAVNIAYKKSTYQYWKIDLVTQIDSSDGIIVYVIEVNNEWSISADSDALKETHEIYISSKGEIVKQNKKE